MPATPSQTVPQEALSLVLDRYTLQQQPWQPTFQDPNLQSHDLQATLTPRLLASQPPSLQVSGPCCWGSTPWPSPTGLRARAGSIGVAWSSNQACLLTQQSPSSCVVFLTAGDPQTEHKLDHLPLSTKGKGTPFQPETQGQNSREAGVARPKTSGGRRRKGSGVWTPSNSVPFPWKMLLRRQAEPRCGGQGLAADQGGRV